MAKITIDFVVPSVGSIVADVEGESFKAICDEMVTAGYVDGVTTKRPQLARFFRSNIAAMAEHPAETALVQPPPKGVIVHPGAH